MLWSAAHSGKLTLMTSMYAVEEARRNLEHPARVKALEKLLKDLEITVNPISTGTLPPSVKLPEKDRPVLLAAIAANATHLLTGDLTHFGRYFGKAVKGVKIMKPYLYIRRIRL